MANESREEQWPTVTVVTPTHSHADIFELALYNFAHFDYPKDKIEWIIIDDDYAHPVGPLLPATDDRIRYLALGEEDIKGIYAKYREGIKREKGKLLAIHSNWFYKGRLPIGMKRNMGAKLARGEIIVHMDDDDYYPPSSIKVRVRTLQESGKRAVGCAVLNNYLPGKYVSFKSKKRDKLPLEKQISPASMAYWRTYWEKQGFSQQDINAEGWRFLKGRSGSIEVIEPSGVLVALHWGPAAEIKGAEANGWHFGEIPANLFKFISLKGAPRASAKTTTEATEVPN